MQGFNNQTARPMNPNQAGYNMSMQTNSTPQSVNNAQYQAYNQNYQQQNNQASNQPYMQQQATQPQQYCHTNGNRGYRSQQTQSNVQQPQYQQQYNSAFNMGYNANRANSGYQQQYQQQYQNQAQNSNGYGQQNKPVFPYDKFVRRVFNAWEKGTDSCPPWNDGSFEGLKNDLKQQKPFGFIVVDNVAVLKLPFDETVRNYLRKTYSMTFCGRGKFWGVKAELAVKVMQDLNLATTTGLHLPDGTFYVIPKKTKSNNYNNTSRGYNSSSQQGYRANSGYQQNYQQYQ